MVKSAQRVLKILETVCAEKNGLTQKDLCGRLGIPKSSLSAILADLTASEYLLLDSKTRHYMLGPQVLTLAGRYLDNQDVVGLGRPLVSQLARETGELGTMAVLNNWEALVVYKEDCVKPIMPMVQIGHRLPLHASAVGKALLAHMPEEGLEEYFSAVQLEAYTPGTITDPVRLREELRAIRSGALAYNRDNYREGVSAVALPVFDHTGKAVASISISVLSPSLTPEKETFFEDIITRITARFSRLLGYSAK